MNNADSMTQRQEYLLERIRGTRRPAEPAPEQVLPREEAPLSFAQERLWFLEQLSPGTNFLNESFLLRINGPLDSAALADAFKALSQRHSILRTEFVEREGLPLQRLRADVSVPLVVDKTFRDRGSDAARLAEAAARRAASEPFALDQAPLLRAVLFELDENKALLVVANHHLIADGWSRQLMIRDLGELYRMVIAGEKPCLTRLPFTYADFAVRERAGDQSSHFAEGLNYWAQTLAGAEPMKLPLDHPRKALSQHKGERLETFFDAGVRRALEDLARAEKATPFMVVFAAVAALFHLQGNQDDITIGVPIANRDNADVQQLVGLIAGTVALRIRVDAAMTLREVIRAARSAMIRGLGYAHIPFERVVQELRIKPDLTTPPVYQVMLAQQPELDFDNFAPNVEIEPQVLDVGASRMDLSFDMLLRDGGFAITMEYDTALFEEATAKRMLARLERCISLITRHPDSTLSESSVMPDEEYDLVVNRWNKTDVPLPADATIASQFAAQALATPNAVAIKSGATSLTWQELSERVQLVAGALAKRGIGPETRVGIYVERGPDMVAAILGTIACGAAYVPMDASYPDARLSLILENAGAKCVITTSQSAGGFIRERGVETLCMDDLSGIEVSHPAAPQPHDAAYVMFTSGSTGTPKGVVVEHRNVVNFFAAMDRLLGKATGAWLALTSIAFDISVLELLWTLCRGVTVVLPPVNAKDMPRRREAPPRTQFGILFFSSDSGSEPENRYRLVLESARFADANGFNAIWIPERHFHEFGGLYPNPSVVAAAVAVTTKKISIRAGSVVLPLHHPLRVAEEWSVVDNLSKGRVGLAFASGWHADDFAFASGAFQDRFSNMLAAVEDVKRLWRGERLHVRNGVGRDVAVRAYPPPYNANLPIWLTASSSVTTFETAGRYGTNVLTHLLGQTFEELEEKIAKYRAARYAAGHDDGLVTLMLHTYVAESAEDLARVREPMRRYLASSLDLVRNLALTLGYDRDVESLDASDRNALLDLAHERYVRGHSLLGTLSECADVVDKCRAIGVGEIACLVDFGLPTDEVLDGLNRVRNLIVKANSTKIDKSDEPFEAAISQGVTHFQVTPSIVKTMIETPKGRAALRKLQVLVVGGEALPPALSEKLCRLVPTVINVYGPTETTVWSTAAQVYGDDVNIGTPLANTRVYVLNEQQKPVPIGCPGELYIGGAGVTRGYLADPQANAYRYLRDPFSADPHARVYRTGDIVRWTADGKLRYLGREDGQVKIRGIRIELGEVEHAVAMHPEVRACAARVFKGPNDDQRIVAYVVGRFGKNPTLSSLREFLLDKVPAHLIPNHVVAVDALPLTSNGKLDRSALPPPVFESMDPAAGDEPSTAIERALAEIWKSVLGVRSVTVQADFFESGGHSLAAVQFVNRCRERFGIALPVARFIEEPTIAAVSRIVESNAEAAAR